MFRMKRSIPYWPSPSSLNTTNYYCGRDGLTDYCRFYGTPRELCEGSTNACTASTTPPSDGTNHAASQIVLTHAPPLEFPIYIAIGIYCFLTVCCFLFCTLLLILLVKSIREFKYPIYKLVIQLCICYLLVSISHLFTNVPLYTFRVKFSESITTLPLAIEMLATVAALVFYTLITINRLAIFILSSWRPMFTGKTVLSTIVGGWIVSIFCSLFLVFYGCKRTYIEKDATYMDVCIPTSPILLTTYQIIFFAVNSLPFIDLAAYFLIGISICHSRRGLRQSINRSEIELLIQSAVIVFLYTVTDVVFLMGPWIPTQSFTMFYTLHIIYNSTNILLGIMFVMTFVLTNKTVRKGALNMYMRRSTKTSSIETIHLRSKTGSLIIGH